MNKDNKKPSREERLAQKLRENLRRRKVQTKAIDGAKTQEAENQGDKATLDEA